MLPLLTSIGTTFIGAAVTLLGGLIAVVVPALVNVGVRQQALREVELLERLRASGEDGAADHVAALLRQRVLRWSYSKATRIRRASRTVLFLGLAIGIAIVADGVFATPSQLLIKPVRGTSGLATVCLGLVVAGVVFGVSELLKGWSRYEASQAWARDHPPASTSNVVQNKRTVRTGRPPPAART